MASPLDLLEFPVLQEFTELTYHLVEAIESSKQNLQLRNHEIDVLRESVRSLDLRLSTEIARCDVSSKQGLEATAAETRTLRESLGSLDLRLSGIAQQLDVSSRKPQQATSEEVAALQENVASLNGRFSVLVEQSVSEQKARFDLEARTAFLEKEIASSSQIPELDLASLEQALAATRSQCLMLESQQKALAIKVEELIEQVAPIASPAPSPNLAESVDQDSHGTVGKNEWLATSPGAAKPRQAVATSQWRGSAIPLPLFVGGLAASALLGGGLVVVGPNLFPQPEPGTAATTVPLLRKPLPASAKASRPPGPTATVSKPAPPAKDKLKIYCPAVCWVEVRRVVDGKKLYDGILKGSIQFPIGKGLHVSSGRSDILKLKINDGSPFVLNAREMLSSRLITSTS